MDGRMEAGTMRVSSTGGYQQERYGDDDNDDATYALSAWYEPLRRLLEMI